MKLAIKHERGVSYQDIVHRCVEVSTLRDSVEVFSRYLIVCHAVVDPSVIVACFTPATVNCIACLAMEVRLKCRRGACGELTAPALMCLHRDTLEAYCVK